MSENEKGNSISREEFNAMLKDADLTKKDFAKYLQTSYNTINAWGSNNREVPYWVKSWLRLYICCSNGNKLRKLLKDNICNNSSMKKFFTAPLPIINK